MTMPEYRMPRPRKETKTWSSCDDSSGVQVSLKTDHRGGMQRHEAAFLKLRFPNHQPVFRDVLEAKI